MSAFDRSIKDPNNSDGQLASAIERVFTEMILEFGSTSSTQSLSDECDAIEQEWGSSGVDIRTLIGRDDH